MCEQDTWGIQNLYRVYLIHSTYCYKMESDIKFLGMEGSVSPLPSVWGSAPVPVFLYLFRVKISLLRNGKKTKSTERPISAQKINKYKYLLYFKSPKSIQDSRAIQYTSKVVNDSFEIYKINYNLLLPRVLPMRSSTNS